MPCACAGQLYPRALLHMLSRITRPWVTCWGLQGMHLALGKILNRALKSTRAAKCHQLLLISLKVNNLPGFGSGGLELRRRGRLLRRQKCPGRRSEMVELRSNSAKSSAAFHPIYLCESGRRMGWQVKLDCETSLISCAFPTPPLPSLSFPSGIPAA